MIKKFYYSVWVDAILQLQQSPLVESSVKKHWKFYSQFFISLLMGFNFMFISFFMPKIINLFEIQINIFQKIELNYLLIGLLVFFLPMIIVNYFLIFWKDKYKIIITNYKFHNGRLFKHYCMLSIFIPMLVLVIGFIISRL
jgi:hypothetical protein